MQRRTPEMIAFARSRGLVAAHRYFSLRQLARRTNEKWSYDHAPLFSAGLLVGLEEYYREPTRPWLPAAIVVHVHVELARFLTDYAERHGLMLEVLPSPHPDAVAVLFRRLKVAPPIGAYSPALYERAP